MSSSPVRSGTPSKAGSRHRRVDWHERLLVGVAVGPPLLALAKRVLDGATRRQSVLGEAYWYTDGSGSKYVFYALVAGTGLCAVLAILDKAFAHERWLSLRHPVTLFAAWAFSTAVIHAVSPSELALLAWAALVLLGAASDTLRARTKLRIAWVASIAIVTNYAYILLSPSTAIAPCRPDGKCGAFGSLWNGFFPQENFMAIYFVCVLPFLVVMPNKVARFTAFGSCTLLVLATGSRIAILATGLALIVLFLGLAKAESAWRFPRVLAWLPLAAFAASTWVFFTASFGDFTGRGAIWHAVREQVSSRTDVLFGTGSGALQRAYQVGTLPFLPTHEHGQFPHVYVAYGLVGVGLFGLMLFRIARPSGELDAWRFSAAVVIITSPFFVTETLFQFSPDDASLWVLIALAASTARRSPRAADVR